LYLLKWVHPESAEADRDGLLPDGSTTHRVVDDALRLLRMTVAAASGKAIPGEG
jgi:hypothetical protein